MNRPRKKHKGVTEATKRIREARAERTVANLREHYERGQRANQDVADYPPRELAQIYRVNPHTLRKDRKFAECYTEEELNELLSLRRPGGLPLHWGHVIYLITINPKTDRRRMQKKAAVEGWSAPELYTALRQLSPAPESRGGRPVKVPEDMNGKVWLMAEETQRWLKRYESVCGDQGQALVEELNANGKESLRESARVLAEKLNRMSRASGKLSNRLLRVLLRE